jgi:predicted class III extradiol MEMO1 family dioxygenase
MGQYEMYADEKSILGLWANYLLADVGVDESVVVFDSDGTGFIHYHQIDFDIIDTFKWKMDRTYLSVMGHEMFNTDNGVLSKVGKSIVGVENIQVHLMKRKSIQGSEVDAIQFTELLDWTCDENDVFGLLYGVADKGYQAYLERFRKIIS